MEVINKIPNIHTEAGIVGPSTDNELPEQQGEIIIEEITRNHKLLHRHRLNQAEVSIGRDYHNDIILSDPHICPQHLSLSFSNGQWQLNDKNSVNGTRLEKNNAVSQDANQQAINDGDVILIGKSQLRVIFKTHLVEDTIAFSPFESLIDFIRHPVAVFISIALFMLIAGNISYLNQPTELNLSQLLVSAFSMSLLFSLWPAGVALVSHLTKHDPRILAQLGISFTFFILLWLSDFLEEIISFNFASNSILTVTVSLLPIGLAFSLFWLNSYIGFHVSAKRRMIVAICITTLLFGGSYLNQYSKRPDFNPHPQYNSTIMAPSYLIAPSNNVDEFLKQSNALFEQANNAAKQD
ncbi:FHA domain-containing protein [Colwellia psychrerythraea]|uniref:FHA domain containing protein n=1 Tax=Colwellia psychrerythraea TaxID=28229 RepID=A0A099KJG0_COLPS|nr:FHA domain-containing protein [Colwellia psychrerythraea]KGJ89718.1 FHA domain containing protein [Colwellia psychrerythraea]